MKILIIGDRHVGGYGLIAGQLSFVDHFIRQISQTGRAVAVEAYMQSTLSGGQMTIRQLPLEHYDLIILQAGQGCLDHPSGLGSVFVSNTKRVPDVSGDLLLPDWLSPTDDKKPAELVRRISEAVQFALMKGMAALGMLPRFVTVRQELTDLLALLKPYRHKVILLSPFPHPEPIYRWLRQQGRTLFMCPNVRQLFSVFDSDAVIHPREEYFLTDKANAGYLNAVGHELVGRALFDFYLAAPTIVAIHSIRRGQDEL